ncbi:MAG: AAA family ATPase, partial [Candidatus Hydrogenedentes bacterium]|nr:AAA family ATPase [Candidatus Hydrogenedentota bacterium]
DKGAYEWVVHPDLAALPDLPQWFLDGLKKEPEPRQSAPAPPATYAGRSPYAAAALSNEVEAVAGSVEGQRNAQLNRSACALGSLVAGGALDEGEVTGALVNAALSAGLGEHEARATIASGLAAGMRTPRTPQETRTDHRPIEHAPKALKPPDGQQGPQNDGMPAPPAIEVRSLPHGWQDEVLPAHRFALGAAFPAGAVSNLHAQGGMGKSTFLLTAMTGYCIGIETVPGWRPAEPGRALYLTFEDSVMEVQRRAQRIARAYGMSSAECAMLADRLKIVSQPKGAFFQTGPGGTVIPGEAFRALEAALAGHGPFGLVVIDPKASMLGGGLEENGNALGQRVVNLLCELAGQDTALVIADHVAKSERQTAGSARGAGSWTDSARQAWSMRPLTDRELEPVPKEDRDNLIVLGCLKNNYGPPGGNTYLRRLTREGEAGALVHFDMDDALRRDAESFQNRLRANVARSLENRDMTMSEITGHSSSVEGRKTGSLFRDDIAAEMGCKVTTRMMDNLLRGMLLDGLVVEEKGPEGRKVLRAVNP